MGRPAESKDFKCLLTNVAKLDAALVNRDHQWQKRLFEDRGAAQPLGALREGVLPQTPVAVRLQ